MIAFFYIFFCRVSPGFFRLTTPLIFSTIGKESYLR